HAILGERGEGSEPIALLFAPEAPVIAAILGVLKAGKIYVPLDPASPPARLAYLLEDSQAPLLLCDHRNRAAARELAGPERNWIDVDVLAPSLSEDNPKLSIAPDTLANILYTSGSTGQPKGVFNNHRNILHEAMDL